MKNLLKLIVLLASLNIGAQETDDATDFLTGLIVSNATEVTTATKIPVLDGNLKLNTWISADNLKIPSGNNKELQFNDAGSFGASSNLTYDKSTSILRIDSSIPNTSSAIELSNFVDGGALMRLRSAGANLYFENLTSGLTNSSSIHLGGGFIALATELNPQAFFTNINGTGFGTNTPNASVEVVTTDPTKDFFRLSSSDATSGDILTVEKSTGNVGIGTATPDASAKLELSSITQGFLPPRMTEAQKNAITSPAEGLRIYQTDGTKGWYGFDGTNWRELGLSKTVAKGEFRSLVDQFANDVTETLIDFEVRIGLQNVEWNNTNKTIKNTSQNDITLHLEPQIGRRSTGLVAEIEIWVDISDDGINWDPLDGYAIFKNITNSTSSVAPLTTVLAPNQYARFGMILDTNVSDTGIISNGQGVTNPGASLSGRVVPSVELNITNN